MSPAANDFRLGLSTDWISPSSPCFRPPSWPPPRDWIVSVDLDGKAISRWGDSTWDLSQLAGTSFLLNFGDGDFGIAPRIDPENADLLRLAITWRLWGPRPARTTKSLRDLYQNIRPIFVLCSREGILASQLMRFPRVLEQVSSALAPGKYDTTIAQLHRIYDARDNIGFTLVDPIGLERLASMRPDHDKVQTAYIPPRIWTYQIKRLRECIDDFLAHARQIEDCFNFCVDAYAHNAGSLRAAVTSRLGTNRLPFVSRPNGGSGVRTGYQLHGAFHITAERYGIKQLLERWTNCPAAGPELKHLTMYLTMVQYVGLAYIANFTLQRVGEAMSLRTDCLQYEDDEKLGRVPIICGETTKTEQDSDARWPTSPSIQVAVHAMTVVAKLRMRCAAADPNVAPSADDQGNPYLFDRAFEPWASCGGYVTRYTIRKKPAPYGKLVKEYPKLFDDEQMRITEADLKIARMLTPNLPQSEFAVGRIWRLAYHQLRRTSAVNMFASGMLSDSSMQFLMKHSTRLMPLYYGRGYTKLHLNEDAEGLVIATMYEVMAQSILGAMGDRFVSPRSGDAKQEMMQNLISERDAKELSKAARRGEIFFRETRLGACTTRGNCSYGGIESIARCAGGDGNKPCADALYDRAKAPGIAKELTRLDQELSAVPVGSPRHKALLAERNGLENFLNVVRT